MQRLVLFVAFFIVIGLIALLLTVALGIFPGDQDATAEGVSPAAAASAEEKLNRLTSDGEEARLTGDELTSLFRYRPDVWSIERVQSPVVEMSRDSVRLTGRVASDELPADVEIGSLRALLPDTADVQIAGTVRSVDGSGTVLAIGSVEVAGMPIPPRLYSRFFESNAVRLPLPTGISSARVEGGELILTP